MRKYFDPEMNISKFSVNDIVTTSEGGIVNPQADTNYNNAVTYLKNNTIAATDILDFTTVE